MDLYSTKGKKIKNIKSRDSGISKSTKIGSSSTISPSHSGVNLRPNEL